MLKQKNLIKAKLIGSGTLEILSPPVKLHKDNFNNCNFQVLIPPLPD